MHSCFITKDFTKNFDIKQSPEHDGYILTSIVRIIPVSKTEKIQQKQKFGITYNNGDTKIVSGAQMWGFGLRIRYCPLCGERL